MRKLTILILAIVLILVSLVGCGNMSMGAGNYTFEHVHFSDGVSGHCATVESWHDNEVGVEVKTTEYGSLYLSEGSYNLLTDGNKCPYCH